MNKRTKIVCTMGPACDDDDILREMIKAGMNVARFNFSHGSHEEQRARMERVKRISGELGIPVGILLDTKGPEIRTGFLEGHAKVALEPGSTVTVTAAETSEDLQGNAEHFYLDHLELPREVHVGSTILIDDGLIGLTVKGISGQDMTCYVENGGELGEKKGVNVPNVKIKLPALTDKDKEDIVFGVKQGFDFIAASFVRTADCIREIKAILEAHDYDMGVIAKIENAEGIENLDEIIEAADGIMVARGDLGVEIPLEEIPIIQKELIKKAYNAGLQVITATQMLDSMMKNPRPTRAESTDVANAIYDGTSAIMLSGETAAGSYPVIALQTMARIAERTEEDIDYVSRFQKRDVYERPNVTSAISHATCTTAHDLGAVAIMGVSKSGKTARMISKYRPKCPIICGTTDAMVWRQMNLSWGVTPIMIEEKTNTDELFEHVVSVASALNLVNSGDLVVITAGVPLGVSGTTNLLKVHLVGNALVSGIGVNNASICGNLCVCATEEEALKNFKPGDILVVPQTSNRLLDILKDCSGIITETLGINSHAAIVGLALDLPVLVGAENATKLLKSGTTVTLDCQRGIVFSGTSHHLPRPNR